MGIDISDLMFTSLIFILTIIFIKRRKLADWWEHISGW